MAEPSNPRRPPTELGTAPTLVQHARETNTRTDELTMQMFRIAPGTMVDHFQVIRSLGRGASGEVYLARDTKLGRKVALKIIHLTGSEEATSEFLREAQATAQFNHPHIVTIFASGEVDSHPYVALEYLEGGDLRRRLQDGPLSVDEAIRTALAVAEALTEAHRHDILHRDLKPENVVLPVDGRVRVVDFGLAQLTQAAVDEAAVGKNTTPIFHLRAPKADQIAGTPEYMAPEQWLLSQPTTAVDIWAFGVLLFEMLSGRVPYALTEPVRLDELARAVCSSSPAPRVTTFLFVPPTLDKLIAECLEKDPEDRPSAEKIVWRLRQQLVETTTLSVEPQDVFRGLAPYEEAHAAEFFGRESEVAAFLERVRKVPVLPVVGPAGGGKTSFVQAGVLPRLRERGYTKILTVRPGHQPFRALASRIAADPDHREGEPSPDPAADLAEHLRGDAMRLARTLRRLADRGGTKVVLFVDQLEDLFVSATDPAEQRAYLEAVLTAADDFGEPVRVILAVRDNDLGRLVVGDAARQALSSVTVVRAPDPDRLVEILVTAANVSGYVFEDDRLPHDMVAEVRDEPNALPLVAFAARLLFERRDKEQRLLLRRAYVEMGGVSGALAKHADGVLVAMSERQIEVTRRLLLRLVTSNGNRRAITRDQALGGLPHPDGEEVLNRLLQARILAVRRSAGEGYALVEIAQESLTRTWGTLGGWILQGRDRVAFVDEVTQAARLWDKRGRIGAELWQGRALAEALQRLRQLEGEVPDLARLFLERGRQRDRRRRWQLRGAAIFGALVAVVVMVVLFVQKREADEQRDRALRQQELTEQQRAEALRQAARAAFRGGRTLEARAEVRAAFEIADTTLARALWWELDRVPDLWTDDFNTVVYDVAFSPSGDQIAIACQSGVVYLVDVETKMAQPVRGHVDQVTAVAFTPDGRQLLSGSWLGRVIVRRVDDLSVVREWSAHDGDVWSFDFTEDGEVVTSSGDHHVKLWKLSSGELVRDLDHGVQVRGARVIPGATRLVSGGGDGKLRIWSLVDGELLKTIDAHSRGIENIALSPDGRHVLSGSRDLTAKLWDVETGENVLALTGHRGGVRGLAFSADGRRMATGSRRGELRIWDRQTGSLDEQLDREGSVLELAFRPAGDTDQLAAASFDRLVLLRTGGRSSLPRAHARGVYHAAFSPDGATVATGSYDGTVMLWDAARGEVLRVLEGHEDTVHAVAFTPDGRHLVSASGDRTARVWEPGTGSPVATLVGADAALYTLDVTSDSNRIVSAGTDGTVAVWSRGGTLLQRFQTGADDTIKDVRLLTGDKLVVTASKSGRVQISDWARGKVSRELGGAKVGFSGVTLLGEGVVAAGDEQIWWWPDQRTPRRLVERAGLRFLGIAALPDRRRMIATDSSGLASLWDVPEGKELGRFVGHGSEVNSAAVDDAGKRLLTASDDGTVRIWDVATQRPIWRTAGFLRSPLRLYTHRGWQRLEGDGEVEESSALGRAVADARRVVPAEEGAATCVQRRGGTVALWPTPSEASRRVVGRPDGDLLPFGRGCVLVTDDGATIMAPGAEPRNIALDDPVLALGAGDADTRARLLVAAGERVLLFDESGEQVGEVTAGAGVTAVTLVDDVMVVGHRDGNLQRLALGEERSSAMSRRMELTPAAAVTRLLAGPKGTVVVGYGDGTLGMWEVSSGTRLGTERLHGPVQDILLVDRHLIAASGLGQHLTWDLSAFHASYCDLMTEMWDRVSVRWQDGGAVLAPRPADHACAE